MLQNQTNAWNKGNLVEFMKGYWENDSLCFIGKNGPKYGYENTLKNYQKSYPDTASMGKLYFDILKIEKLSNLYYSVIGKWTLIRTKGNISGYYTLLFKKINGQWKVVLDHSS
ncbi:MAG: nuclear transport factor 2 family protein [Sediminibacterium sp.]|nr:nuclear transport factor 2 family protein [Sediminibacterium sp.]